MPQNRRLFQKQVSADSNLNITPAALQSRLQGGWIVSAAGLLQDALCHHCPRHFHEARHIGSLHIVCVAVGFLAVFLALGVDVSHDAAQLGVDFLCCPRQFL